MVSGLNLGITTPIHVTRHAEREADMEMIIWFLGFIVGGIFGVAGMCIMNAARTADDNSEEIMLGMESDVRHVINNGG